MCFDAAMRMSTKRLVVRRFVRSSIVFAYFLLLPTTFFGFMFEMEGAVLAVTAVAFSVPTLLAVLASRTRTLRVVPITPELQDRSLHPPSPKNSATPTSWLHLMSHNSANSMYQNFLNVFSCIIYIRACYSLSYEEDETGNFTYQLVDTPFALRAFELAECFCAITIGFDLFLRAQQKVELNSYFFIDFLAFTTFLSTSQVAPASAMKEHLFNSYVASGIFRFLRLRRTLKKLDVFESKTDVIVHFPNRNFIIKWRSAGMIILALRVTQYILFSTSLIMFAEFPCSKLEPLKCNENFRIFHRSLYFIIVTLATVGYGDMVPCTDLGVICLFFIVLIGAACVPLAVQQFLNLYRDETMEESKSNTQEILLSKVLDRLERIEGMLKEETKVVETFEQALIENTLAMDDVVACRCKLDLKPMT